MLIVQEDKCARFKTRWSIFIAIPSKNIEIKLSELKLKVQHLKKTKAKMKKIIEITISRIHEPHTFPRPKTIK
jgi:hypothetical protein